MEVFIRYNYDREEFYFSATEGATHEDIKEILQDFLEAMEYGVEPHLNLVKGGKKE